MADKQVVVSSFPGQSNSALKVFPEGLGEQIESQAATADSDDGSLYIATFTSLSEIRYRWRLYDSTGELVSGGFVAIGEGTGPHFDEEMVEASCGDSSAGTGARTVTVTISDSESNALLNQATVRLTEGSTSAVATTNANGVATLAVDDATYRVALTKAGYAGQTASLVVDGDEDVFYTLVAKSFASPPSAETAVGRIVTYSEQGVVESGAGVSVQVIKGTGGKGIAADGKVWTITSNDDGLCEFAGLFKGWTYRLWRGPVKTALEFVVPSTTEEGLDGNDSFNIVEVIGAD